MNDWLSYISDNQSYAIYIIMMHPKLAVSNAEKRFSLNNRERNIIYSHMWPIPGAPLPRSKEAWLVCIADKLCAHREMRRAKPKTRD